MLLNLHYENAAVFPLNLNCIVYGGEGVFLLFGKLEVNVDHRPYNLGNMSFDCHIPQSYKKIRFGGFLR